MKRSGPNLGVPFQLVCNIKSHGAHFEIVYTTLQYMFPLFLLNIDKQLLKKPLLILCHIVIYEVIE
jgi:hypothetical protein